MGGRRKSLAGGGDFLYTPRAWHLRSKRAKRCLGGLKVEVTQNPKGQSDDKTLPCLGGAQGQYLSEGQSPPGQPPTRIARTLGPSGLVGVWGNWRHSWAR